MLIWVVLCVISTIGGVILIRKNISIHDLLPLFVSGLMWFSLSPIQLTGMLFNHWATAENFKRYDKKARNEYSLSYGLLIILLGWFILDRLTNSNYGYLGSLIMGVLTATFYFLKLGSFMSFIMKLKIVLIISLIFNLYIIYYFI